MNFLALLLGLGLERLLTRVFHLREFRWLDPVFAAVFARLAGVSLALALPALLVLALLLAAPVLLATLWIIAAGQGLALLLFAVLVLLFSLGPRDLEQEVDEYCAALTAGDTAAVTVLGQELVEHEVAADPALRREVVERAIYQQAGNRIFGVVFWFLLLGPAGAWGFRVADLMRGHAVRSAGAAPVHTAARVLHGLLAWIPARLMAGAFALAGSFESAAAAWRPVADGAGARFFEHTDALVARVGRGARGAADDATMAEAAALGSALGLVRRTLWLIWYPAIALLTLADLLR